MALSRITNPFLSSSGSNNTSITSPAANTIAFTTSTTEDMRIDSSGRVGIAATPSAWSNSWKVCQVGDASTSFTPGGSSYFSTNWLYDGTQKAIGSGSVLIYEQNYSVSGGNHIWYGSATGTAGGTVTLVERMRIDSSGNVGIGVTPSYKLDVRVSDGTNPAGYFYNTSASSNSPALIARGGANNADAARIISAQDYGGNEEFGISGTGQLRLNAGFGSAGLGYVCRAWVNFNGTGTVAIRSSGNVSSITDGGVGIYRVNFSTAMPDVNFSTNASVAGGGTVNSSTCAMLVNATTTAAAGQTSNVSYVDVFCYHPGNQVAQDNAWVSVSVNR